MIFLGIQQELRRGSEFSGRQGGIEIGIAGAKVA